MSNAEIKLKLSVADVRLNINGKSKRMLVIKSKIGSLFVDEELFSLYFPGEIPNDIEIKHVKNIET